MIPCNRMKTIISLLLLLAVVKLIHCQDHEQMIVLTLQAIMLNLESINGQLKGHDELLQRIPDMQEKFQHLENSLQDVQEKLEHLENNLQDMQEKLQHLENNLQDVQQEQGNLKTYFQGLSRETAQCLKGEDLEHLTNVSAAANQEIKSFHEEMSEVIAWSRKDKCSEGSLLWWTVRIMQEQPVQLHLFLSFWFHLGMVQNVKTSMSVLKAKTTVSPMQLQE
ncbi:uncharacterized protein [Palaemon carinicauda]|uniref:uncharacterized protein isoform X2 n=1 Tax=Palaemon carinicauda TaxID=392227 RepID=UPI0035B5FC9B